MTPSEVTLLLAQCAGYDCRTIGESDTAAWHDALGDVPYADASTAVVEHYARTSEWIRVADVRAGVRRIRAERLKRADAAPPPEVDPDDVPAYLAALRRQRREIADGADVPRSPELPVRPVAALVRGAVRRIPKT